MAPNKTLVFKRIPAGFPQPGVDLVVESRDTDIEQPPPGGIIVEVLYSSFDPYLRGRMRDAAVRSYVPAFALDGPVSNDCISRVLASDSPAFAPGDLVEAMAPIAQYARFEAADLAATAAGARRPPVRLDNPHRLDLGLFLGPLGMPGLTAWSGLYRIGRPRRGETLFVSSAAGAVGQLVGQLAKREGLTVIGSVGSDAKRAWLTDELGFDAAFNYKTETPAAALARLAPRGIDIYFDNVGGCRQTLESMHKAKNDWQGGAMGF